MFKPVDFIKSDPSGDWQAMTHPEDAGWFLCYEGQIGPFPLGVNVDRDAVQRAVDMLNRDAQDEAVLTRFIYRFCGFEW